MIVAFILFRFLEFFKINPATKLEIIIILLVPSLLFASNPLKYESPIYTVKYLFNFYLSKKVYLYTREHMQKDV